MKKTLSWLMVLLMVFGPFAGTVINASAEVPNQDNAVIASEEQDGTQSETEQSSVDTISTTMNTTSIPEQSSEVPYEVVVVHPEGGHFTGGKDNYPTLNVTLQGERMLPKDLSYWEPVRDGYRFDGWYAKKDGSLDTKYSEGQQVPEDVTDLYASWVRVVVLDAEPGSFNTQDAQQNYTRTVDIKDGKLPKDVDVPVFNKDEKGEQSVEFEGWYTQKASVTRVQHNDSEGSYWTLSIQNNGQKIEADQQVPDGITTLYAGYKVKDGVTLKKTITYYYDWNGIDGRWGQCLTSTRAYNESDHGYKLTAEDLLIRYLNWDGEKDLELKGQESLNEYWKGKTFDGYTFKGWATQPTATEPDVEVGDVVKDGESLYAVWEKDGKTNENFDRTDPSVGPLEFMHFDNLNIYAHGIKDSKVTVSLITTPVKANLPSITWTLTYGESSKINDFAPPTTKTGTVKADSPYEADGIKATASGWTLTIENTDGNEHGITVSATATLADGTTITTPADASVMFGHKWSADAQQHKDPTCTERGSDTYKCEECDATMTKAIPPLEHVWDFRTTKEATCTTEGVKQEVCIRDGCNTTFEQYQQYMAEKYGKKVEPEKKAEVIPAKGHDFAVTSTNDINEQGMRCYTEECHDCHTTESGQYGDVNQDGEVSLLDAVQLYQYISGQVDNLSQEVAGDIDGSENVSLLDAVQLYQYVSGQISSL